MDNLFGLEKFIWYKLMYVEYLGFLQIVLYDNYIKRLKGV